MKTIEVYNKFLKIEKNICLLLIKNNLPILFISFFFLLLILGNKIYNYKLLIWEIKITRYNFPEISIEEKNSLQEQIIKQSKNFKDVLLYIYQIKIGENYWQIARENGVDIDTIIGVNPYLKNLYAGLNEKIIVANRKGCLHIVKKNETIYHITKLYEISVREIKKFNKINFIEENFGKLKEGKILFIPNRKPVILTEKMKYWYNLRNQLQSPLGGSYTSGYGVRIDPFTKTKKFHNGLDIKVAYGTPVGAAADGIVVAAGWASGYGKMIKIEHFNGYTTLYGHLSKIYVRVGEKVKKGQIIGRSGNTGKTTGPHLHFTVWYNNKPINPALFLW